MTLPIGISIPHAGLEVPAEVRNRCRLAENDIRDDGDGGAAEIYGSFKKHVAEFMTTNIARAVIDLNRSPDDFRKDGVVKTHTCWDVPVYRTYPDPETISTLLKKYYHPYHAALTGFSGKAAVGIDCHTMAAFGPPVGPDPGEARPPACLSNADGTCPDSWLVSLGACLEQTLERKVSLNHPFRGGYIIRVHGSEMPWIQLEFSRDEYLSEKEKSVRLLAALRLWCRKTF